MEFKDLYHAINVFLNSKHRSEENVESFAYILENAPPDLQKILLDGFKKMFPELKPQYCDENGEVYYEISQLAKAFGVTEEEIREAPMMKKADSKIKSSSELYKIQ